MKCVSCSTEINPKWKHAIDTNICPFCGESIMDLKLKDLLSNLRSIMDELMDFPQEVNDWLLSNYNFINVNSDNFVNYITEDQVREFVKNKNISPSSLKEKKIVKVNNGEKEEEIEVITLQDQEKTNEFVERAGLKKKNESFKNVREKNKHLKKMVERIKSGEIVTSSEMEEDDDLQYSEEEEEVSEEEVNDILTHSINTSSSGLNSSLYDDEELPPVVESMLNVAKNNPNYNAKDIAKLQKLQNQKQSSLNNMLNGGNLAKGGFSR